MLRIRKLDKFVVKSFLLLFVGTFFICQFIFMMQFLWKYMDELVGKGLTMGVMAQFFFYSGLTLVPMALPLAVLLSTLITFGNFGERYELLAMKAAGVSLLKVMRPLIVVVGFFVLISLYFQNVIAPLAHRKLGTLLISVREKSPELDIPEGVFYSDIPDYNLKVKKKNRETGMLYDVLIYNFSEGFENAHIIYADSGRLEMTADKRHLWLHLFHGDLFENLRSQNMDAQSVPYRRETFREKHTLIEFNSDFNMADASIMSSTAGVKNMKELSLAVDSMKLVGDSIGRQYYQELSNDYSVYHHALTPDDSLKIQTADLRAYNIDSLYAVASLAEKQTVINAAYARVSNLSNDLDFKNFTLSGTDRSIRRHEVEWHRKLAIAFSCLVFFFIGAPLGGIIRKGGLGMPVIVSVMLFIIYYVIDNTGFKLARDGKWLAWMGMWLSTAVLAPLGAFLTYKSNRESVVFNAEAYLNALRKFLGVRGRRHVFRKEVIITDPDYVRLPHDLRLLSAACQDYLRTNRLRKAPNYLRLWTMRTTEDEVIGISNTLESLVEEMSNTRSPELLTFLNDYPILVTSAHTRPFASYGLNLVVGLVLPVGLFFYLRIWMFRLRLNKDLERIVAVNDRMIEAIDRINQQINQHTYE